MEKPLSEKESFDLINVMINSARNNLQKGTGKIFLFWGYIIAVLALLNLGLLLILPDHTFYYAFYIWFAMPLGLVGYYFQLRKMGETQIVKTHIEKIVTFVWIAFSISIFVLVISMLLISFQNIILNISNEDARSWIHWSFLIPFMLILYGFALFVSGMAYRFKPLITGAVICWLSAILTLLFLRTIYSMEIQLVGLIVSLIAGYIIPGHLLNIKEKKYVS